jgi:hypothetical protein
VPFNPYYSNCLVSVLSLPACFLRNLREIYPNSSCRPAVSSPGTALGQSGLSPTHHVSLGGPGDIQLTEESATAPLLAKSACPHVAGHAHHMPSGATRIAN